MIRRSPISFSIYYSRQEWPNLLKNCLAPLIQELETAGICSQYTLSFCEEQGEHLRLVLHLQSTDLHQIPFYQSTIETFLSAHPTKRIIKPLPLQDTFFLDLPNNSVYLNIFKPNSTCTPQLNSDQTALIRKEISALMLDTFAEHMLDEESLFNFYLCLEIVALAVFGNPLNAAKVLQADCEKLADRLPVADLIRLQYEANKLIKTNLDDLNQMVTLIADGDCTADTEWLANWLQICRQMVPTVEPISIFKDISMLICRHINFYHPKWSTLALMVMNRLLTNYINQSILQPK
ncbi:hypothetical protein SAMN04487898_101160 [Pedobacter sp. ok626]|uniref:lantibiotic dehydratase C-terminal domain-containing protein n=1 Tax=Pedobacter sp. ok626 TaxID=1761882 RepID=UPI00088A7E1A|nr:lantibiotic dehydratase C-terminal domain-containing protein [Pedobacter sp. ok626]SDJ04453.1 hypothetical protein SAMN04487898_101160 [Pedobacter sp. ok626]